MLTRRLRIIVADDHALVRGLVRSLLAMEPDLDVVAEVPITEALPTAIEEHRPDAVVLDSHRAGRPGTGLVRDVRARWPSLAIVSLSRADPAVDGHAAPAADRSAGISTKQPELLAVRLRRAVPRRADMDPAA